MAGCFLGVKPKKIRLSTFPHERGLLKNPPIVEMWAGVQRQKKTLKEFAKKL